MVVIAQPVEQDFEALVLRVFLKSIDVLGGLSKLADYKTLTWLPSLARAVYCVVLREEYFKTEEEIAQRVGLTIQTGHYPMQTLPKYPILPFKEDLTNLER